MLITLPQDSDNQFNLSLLIRHLINQGRTYIIQAQQHEALENHSKDLSLDYWIRQNIANNRDTAQATNEVIEQICATGLFKLNLNLNCPNSGRNCAGIELI